MKKMMTGLVAMLAVTLSFAQAPMDGKMHGKDQHGKMEHHSGRHHCPGMDLQKLNLSNDQKAQMKNINEDFKQKMQVLNGKEDITVKEQRDQKAALGKAHKQQIEKLLTPEQKTQLAQMKADEKKKREEMAAKRLDQMKEKLSLTDAQYASLKKQQEQNKQQMESIMKNDQLDRESKKQQMMALRSETKKNWDEILTPEQKQKMEDWKKEQHQRTKDHKGWKNDGEDVK